MFKYQCLIILSCGCAILGCVMHSEQSPCVDFGAYCHQSSINAENS